METSASIRPVREAGPSVARPGSAPLPRLTLSRLGASLVASALLHAALIGTLGQGAAGGAGVFHREAPGDSLHAIVSPRTGSKTLKPAADEPAATPSFDETHSRVPGGEPPSGRPRQVTASSVFAAIAGPAYFAPHELDQRPAPLSSIEPEFPELGPLDEGYLVVRVLINEHGRADQVQVLVSDPEGRFDRAVIDAFSAGRYQPGTKDGAPVKSQFLVEVKFHPEGGALGPLR